MLCSADARRAALFLAIGVGVVSGSALRNIPIAVVDLMLTPDRNAVEDCGVEAAVECAVRATPGVIVEVARFGFAVLAIAVLLAIVGAAATVTGSQRLRSASPPAAGDQVVPSPQIDRSAVVTLACGVALLMPAVWLAASFALWVAA